VRVRRLLRRGLGEILQQSAPTMWTRGVAGALLSVTGAVWIAQGTNVLHGSGMSGEGRWAVIGVVTLVVGVALLAWAWQIHQSRAGTMDAS
jgi:hypothetical protein